MKVRLLLALFLAGAHDMYGQFVFPSAYSTSQSVTCTGCSVSTPSASFNNDFSDFASIHVGVSLVSSVTLTLTFSPAVSSNSVVSLVVEDAGSSFNLVSGVSYDLMNGGSGVSNSGWTTTPYGGSSTKQVLSTVANGTFNRIRITLSGVLTSSKTLNVYEVATSSTIPLPVQLLSLTGLPQSDAVVLSWNTLSAVNHQAFEVQRSVDGTQWRTLEYITKMPQPESITTYHYTDTAPTSGINYYRLRQINTDGSYTYTKIIQVSYTALTTIQVYPNPVSRTQPLSIHFTSATPAANISLYDFSGHCYGVQSMDVQAGPLEFQMPAQLSPGLYYLHIRAEDQEMQQKIWVK